MKTRNSNLLGLLIKGDNNNLGICFQYEIGSCGNFCNLLEK